MSLKELLEAFHGDFPERMVQIDGRTWRYRTGGAGPALVLLPGGELVNDFGFEFAESLKSNCRILYPAYPRTPSIGALAAGVARLIEIENLAPVAMLGASFGGYVAQLLVRAYPHLMGRLILSNTGVPQKNLIAAVRATILISILTPEPLLRGLVFSGFFKLIRAPADDRPFWREWLRESVMPRIAKADFLQNAKQQLEYHRTLDFRPDDLEGWPGKILVIESDDDINGPVRRKALRDMYPQARVRTFHEAGHVPLFTRKNEYLALVREFLGPE